MVFLIAGHTNSATPHNPCCLTRGREGGAGKRAEDCFPCEKPIKVLAQTLFVLEVVERNTSDILTNYQTKLCLVFAVFPVVARF